MKVRRLLIVAGAGIVLAVFLALAWSGYWEHKQMPFRNAPKLISSLQAFSRDQAAAGRRLPPEISLQDLLRGGYLTTNDVRAFEGMEVTFSTTGAEESNPQMILARARTPDGQFVCLLADGSVQGLTREMYEELRTNLGQPSRGANGSQPIGSGTNRTPVAAGSRRSP